jgi:prepilin-type N-terminal cleavage/methylation domain-containing protein
MNQNGFSLMEVTVTVAALSIGAMMGTVQLTGVTSQAVGRQHAEKVRLALIKARDLAKSTLDCVDVNIAQHQISLTRYTTCAPSLLNPISTEMLDLGNQLTMEIADPMTPTHITFTATGGTLQPTTQLTARAIAGKSYQYTVMSAIGIVRMDL